MRTTRSMSNSRRTTAIDPHVSPSVDLPPRRVTRSMFNSRRETFVDPRATPGLDLPPRKVPRSMSKARRQTTVDPYRRITTRSKAYQWDYPLMTLPDLRRPLSSCKKKSAVLKQQYKEVLAYIKHKKDGPPTVLDFSKIRYYQLSRCRHTLETQREALNAAGIKVAISRASTPEQEAEAAWHRTVADLVRLITRNIPLPQRDLISLFEVSRRIHNTLASMDSRPLWKCLDFHGMKNAGDRLVEALSMPRYHHVVEDINLEFAEDIEDKHLKLLKTKCGSSVGFLESLNLSGCQKISDRGIKDITSVCPRLKRFSIHGNFRVTDLSMKYLANNCKFLTDLNLPGCEGRSEDELLRLFPNLRCLNGVDAIKCPS